MPPTPGPDPIAVACPSCGKSLRVPPGYAGRSVGCKSCRRSFVVPAGPVPDDTPAVPDSAAGSGPAPVIAPTAPGPRRTPARPDPPPEITGLCLAVAVALTLAGVLSGGTSGRLWDLPMMMLWVGNVTYILFLGFVRRWTLTLWWALVVSVLPLAVAAAVVLSPRDTEHRPLRPDSDLDRVPVLGR